GTADDNVVAGNAIGQNAAGTTAPTGGSSAVGVQISGAASGNVVRVNAIGGNAIGILLHAGATHTLVRSNIIGGGAPIGSTGIELDGAADNTIGLPQFVCCFPEVIAGPNSIQASGGPGIHVTGRATGNVIQANYVGTSPAWGDFAHAAGNGAGIRIDGSSSGNTIGGTAAGAGNHITGNRGAGVAVVSGTGDAIEGNSIFDNVGQGIDLGGDGITQNDAGDRDTGANQLQNFPVLATA